MTKQELYHLAPSDHIRQNQKKYLKKEQEVGNKEYLDREEDLRGEKIKMNRIFSECKRDNCFMKGNISRDMQFLSDQTQHLVS